MTSEQDILDQALALGARVGWEQLTLNSIAESLDIPLSDIYQHFPQKDDLVEAWFDRADRALLGSTPNPAWAPLPARDRIERVVLAWLDALRPYRTLTGQMLLYKFEPGHVHLQAAGVLRISRTVQWFREAAQLEASHGRRVVQELALSSLYLAVFAFWLNDNSSAQHKTRSLLRRKLAMGEPLGLWY